MRALKTALIAAAVTYITILTLGTFNLLGGAFAGMTTGAAAMSAATMTFVGTLVASGVGMLTSRGMEASKGNFGTKLAGKGAAVPRQLIYGQCRVGGTIVKMETTGATSDTLHLAIVLAGHAIQGNDSSPAGVVALHINDLICTTQSATESGETVHYVTNSDLTNSDNDNAFSGGGGGRLIRFTFHDGSQTTRDGLAATSLSSSYPTTCKFQGMAYVYMEIIYDPEKLPNMPNIWFDVKGKKVFDPRDSSTAWSDNPALIVRDVIADTIYGLKAPTSEINDTSASGGFQAAANICAATVSLPSSGTETRYTLNGMSHAGASLSGLLEGFLSSCAGNITYTNGKFNMFAGGSQTPSLTITDDNTLSDISVSTKSGSGELYNGVKSIYVDKTNNYQAAESPIYESAAYLAQDTPSGAASANFKKNFEAQLPFTVTNTMAQRLQRIQLNKQRHGTMVSLLTTLEFMKCQPSDWVQMTNSRLSYTNKNLEIISMQMEFLENEGQVFAATRLNLQEVSSGIWDYAASDYTTPQATVSNPSGGTLVIPAPTSLALAQQTRQEGPTAKIDILVSWTNSVASGIQGTEIQFKESSGSVYNTATMAGKGSSTAIIAAVDVGITYNVRVRHFSFDNVVSAFTSVVNITIAQPDTIAAPTSVAASSGREGFTEVSWVNPSNVNFRSVELYYGTSSGFTPASGNLLSTFSGEPSASKRVPIGLPSGLTAGTTYYFKLRSTNIYGSASAYTTAVSGSFIANSTAIADGSITVAKFASSIEPVTIVSSVPASKSTDLIYNTTNNLLYRWNGSSYVSAVGASAFSELTGTAATAQIADDAITAAKIGDDAVNTAQLATNAVTADIIAADAVGTSELATNAVTAAIIAADAVNTSELASAAVTTAILADDAVNNAKIATNAIQGDVIAASAITTTKIADNAIATAKIAANAITANEIAANAVTATQINADAVTTAKLAAGAVTADEIASNAITAVKITSGAVTAAKIDTGAVTAEKILADAVTAVKIVAGAVTTAKLDAGAVTADKIGTNEITAVKILAGAVTAAKIDAGAVTTAKLDAGAVTTGKLDALAVTAAKIASQTITATQIASGTITATQILANTITAGQIAAGAISADEIAANSLSVAKLVSDTSRAYPLVAGGADVFQFEMGTSTTIAGFQGAAIFRTSTSSGFGAGGLANAANSVAIMGQQAHNSTDGYGAYFANSTALGSATHRSQAGLCNNARAGIFADAATTVNYTSLCNGTYAVHTTGDMYVDGDITATGTITPFTGMHDGLLADDVSPAIGDILVDSSVAIKRNIANTLFVMAVSGSTNQSAIGIYAGDRESAYVPVSARLDKVPTGIDDSSLPERDPTYDSVFTDRKTVVVNSLGEGQVNVCGQGGDIAAGDLIVTSSTAGKGMKQSSNDIKSITVCKAREAITFAQASDTGQIACIYLCG